MLQIKKIPESSRGENIHMHEIKDLYGDATTSDCQSKPRWITSRMYYMPTL
jgi:hypothetical protein